MADYFETKEITEDKNEEEQEVLEPLWMDNELYPHLVNLNHDVKEHELQNQLQLKSDLEAAMALKSQDKDNAPHY